VTGAVLPRLARLPHRKRSRGEEQQNREEGLKEAGLLPLLPPTGVGLPGARPQHRDGQKPRLGTGWAGGGDWRQGAGWCMDGGGSGDWRPGAGWCVDGGGSGDCRLGAGW
jgi:hypothetical protein